MPRPITFSTSPAGADRVYHVSEDDVRVVLSRLPPETTKRLRAVHFNDRRRGARVLGYVSRGRREIALCALPPRVSLARFLVRGQSPRQFGAQRGTQWPIDVPDRPEIGAARAPRLLSQSRLHHGGPRWHVNPHAERRTAEAADENQRGDARKDNEARPDRRTRRHGGAVEVHDVDQRYRRPRATPTTTKRIRCRGPSDPEIPMTDMTAALARADVFHRLEPEALAALGSIATREAIPAGTELFRQGEPRERLRVIEAGLVEIKRGSGSGDAVFLISYGPGDVLGEGMLLGGYVHSTTATTAVSTSILCIERSALEERLAVDPALRADVLAGILEQVAGRLDQVSPHAAPVHVKLSSGETRREHDLIGDRDVPVEAYYGVQTLRGIENFHITGIPLSTYPDLVAALAIVKRSAARANAAFGQIPQDVADAIVAACDEIIGGKLHNQFVLDMIQGGAGTSTNMNANEVIANRALELLGHEKGDYEHCHPNNHVNCSQSTNDAYPSSLKLAMAMGNRRLTAELRLLVQAFREKAATFGDVVKMGRTQLQDAVPMTLRQEFDAFATSLAENLRPLDAVTSSFLTLVNMGGTAIGTGLNAPEGFPARVAQELAEYTGMHFQPAADLVEATQDTQSFVLYSSSLKSLAVKLSKICNDLRLLSSGPRCGFGDIRLPGVQPGSSIMPGKVNPVIPEVVNQVAFRVIGNDLTVTMAAEAGQLQLNAFEPVIATAVLESIEMLKNAASTLRQHCVVGIEANRERCRENIERSIGIVTALVPILGYGPSTEIAAEALASNRGVVELVRERGLLDEAQITELLSPANMANDHRRV